MFQLTATSLPETALPAGGALVASMAGSIPAGGWVFNPARIQPGIAGPAEVGTTTTTGVWADGVTMITTPTQPVVIMSGGVVFTPATDPSNPQDGEFVYNPYSGQSAVYSSAPLPTAQVIAPTTAVINRERLFGPVPEWFARFPLASEFSINLAFEQHPQGSIALEFGGQERLLELLQALRPDTAIPFWGYGLRVTNLSYTQEMIAEDPQGHYAMSASLGGVQERVLSQPVSVKELGKAREVSVQRLAEVAGGAIEAPEMIVPLKTYTARDLLNAGDEFTKRLRHQGLFADWCGDRAVAVNIDSVRSWYYTDADYLGRPQVTYLGKQDAQALSSTAQHNHPPLRPGPLPLSIAEWSGLSLVPEDPALIGHANEFPVTEIEGWFTAEFPGELLGEDIRGGTRSKAQPRWKQRKPERITLPKGDKDWAFPPDDTRRIKTMSLCYTNSGPTKVITWDTTEDGVPVKSRTQVWGLIYTSRQVARLVDDEWKIDVAPEPYWQVCKDTTTVWVYDSKYGYELGSLTTGWEMSAFEAETDELEALTLREELKEITGYDTAAASALLEVSKSSLDAELSEEARKVANQCRAYNIEKRPVIEGTGRTLRTLADVYRDINPNEGKYVEYKYLGADGKEYIAREADPTHAPPYYIAQEDNFQITFDSMPNPITTEEDADGNRIKLPPLTCGRDALNRTEVTLQPSKNSRRSTSQFQSDVVGQFNVYSPSLDEGYGPDRYTTFQSEFNGSGAQFRDMVVRTTFQESVGRPGVCNRKPPLQEVDPPEERYAYNLLAPRENTRKEFVVVSPGYDPSGPIRDSQSYPYAKTIGQAKTAVRTDAICAEITNPSRTVQIVVPLNLQVRPGDKVQAIVGGIIYDCRVNTVSHSGQLLGVVDGQIEVNGRTQLSLSPGREPDYEWVERPRPTSVFTNVISRRGDVIESNLIRGYKNRRNF